MDGLVIMKRREARELGLSKYFTGKPCANGHLSERYIRGHCVLCMSDIKKKEYKKDRGKRIARNKLYNKKNKEQLKIKHAIWYKENKEIIAEKRKARRNLNIEESRRSEREKREKNKDQINKRKRERYAEKKAEREND